MADEEQQENPVLTTKQIKEQFDAGTIDDATALQLLQKAGAGEELARTTLQSWHDAQQPQQQAQAGQEPDEQPGD